MATLLWPDIWLKSIGFSLHVPGVRMLLGTPGDVGREPHARDALSVSNL